jgi:integrase
MLQWRQGSKQRRFTLGKVGVITLDDARKQARKVLVAIEEGNDPIAEKAKTRVNDQNEFLILAREYLAARAKDMKPRSHAEYKHHLEKYLKAFHQLPVGRIERAMVASELRTIAGVNGPVAADRARSTLSSFFAWLIGEGICENNPVIGTNKSAKEKSRERVLSDSELVEIWRAAPESDYGRIVRLLMLTLQRREEIAGLREDELNSDDNLIALPPERTKNSRPHEVPLSSQAQDVLAKQPRRDDREFVFGEGGGAFSGFSAAKERLVETITERRQKVDKKAKPMPDWTLHDLRRTGATRMADLGIQPHVIEAILNHVSGHKSGVAGIYNRSTYAKEKRAALDLWGAHIAALLANADGASVSVLKKRA